MYLGYNRIDDAGAKELAQALASNQTLTSMYLGYNHLGDASAKELIQALASNQTLTTLTTMNHYYTNYDIENQIERLLERNRKAKQAESADNRSHRYSSDSFDKPSSPNAARSNDDASSSQQLSPQNPSSFFEKPTRSHLPERKEKNSPQRARAFAFTTNNE